MLTSHAIPSFSGMDILTVEAGTEIECKDTGEKLTVTDQNAVTLGRKIYVTKTTADALWSATS